MAVFVVKHEICVHAESNASSFHVCGKKMDVAPNKFWMPFTFAQVNRMSPGATKILVLMMRFHDGNVGSDNFTSESPHVPKTFRILSEPSPLIYCQVINMRHHQLQFGCSFLT
jgi:hypothetical protein